VVFTVSFVIVRIISTNNGGVIFVLYALPDRLTEAPKRPFPTTAPKTSISLVYALQPLVLLSYSSLVTITDVNLFTVIDTELSAGILYNGMLAVFSVNVNNVVEPTVGILLGVFHAKLAIIGTVPGGRETGSVTEPPLKNNELTG